MNHSFVIRSAYAPSVPLDINEYRLAMTELFCIPSLAAQTRKDFIIELRINPHDPLLERRMAAFQSVGVPIVTEHSWGRAIRTRFDDDDAIACDFVDRLRNGIIAEGWYSFPQGFVLRDDRCMPTRIVPNQFLTRVSERGVFEVMHRQVTDAIIIDERPAWLWVRHNHNRSSTVPSMRGSRPLSELEEAFPCASSPPSGIAS